MASRAVAPPQPREGRNRQVLKDIGNLVISHPVEAKNKQITKPVTRSFGAQILANAQATVAEKNDCKKPLVEDGLLRKAGSSISKNTMIVIHVDEAESGIKVKEECEGRSLTAVLTARSKAVCGVSKNPKIDIDAADIDDELAAVEYIEDMHSFYKETEADGIVHDYIESQPEINSKMRGILIDWLIEVHKKFELMPETLYLTVNIVDRFLSLKTVPRRELQLVGISSMLIACKYEEIWAPEVGDFIAISDNTYVRDQVLLMEKAILGKLEWYLTVPTPYVFLSRYIKASIQADNEMENMTFFFAELCITNYSTIIEYSPSMISASAVYAAHCTLNRSPLWTETLRYHTGYEEDELIDCTKSLVQLHVGAPDNKLKAVRQKYSDPKRGAVALFPAAKSFIGKFDEI